MLKHKKMIKYKGQLGRAYVIDGKFKFGPIDNPPNYMKSMDGYEEIDEKKVSLPSINEQDKILLSEHEWLGEPIKVHRIGTHIIVEYLNKEDNQFMFTVKSNSWHDLDTALIYSILDKHEVFGSSEITLFITKNFKKVK